MFISVGTVTLENDSRLILSKRARDEKERQIDRE